ncbi:hypothetical protein, partial [Streptosporangium amethystogenes]
MTSETVSPAAAAADGRQRSFVHRLNFRFSPGGRYAACLAADDRDPAMYPELWDLTGPEPRPRAVRTRDGETAASVPLPTDDGGLLLCRSGAYGSRLTFAESRAEGGRPVEETELIAVRRGGLRLLPGTARTSTLVLEMDGEGGTAVWRLPGGAVPPEQITRVPHPIGGAVWLDERGHTLALAAADPGAGT